MLPGPRSIWQRFRQLVSLPPQIGQLQEQTKEVKFKISHFDERFESFARFEVSAMSRLDATVESLAHVHRIREDLAEIKQGLLTLQRTAPSRGNVLLPSDRLLTRISLPEYFPRADPILLVNANDRLIVPKIAMSGYYELESTHFACRNVKPNDHVVDVGANFGYYTVMFGLLAGWRGRVVAFEPLPTLVTLLRENIISNWIDTQLKVIPAACSDHAGTMRLFTSSTREANTGLAASTADENLGGDVSFEPIDVPTVTIDESLDDLGGRVDFMKIDVEGAEPLVLRGARQTIATNPQIKVMMEWSPGQLKAAGFDLADVASELISFGLQGFILHGKGELSPIKLENLTEQGYQNIVLMRGGS